MGLNMQQKEALARAMVEGLKRGDPEIVEGCLAQGGDPDVCVQDGDEGASRPVLHWVARYFNERAARAIVDHGNVDARDPRGETALFFAIANRNPQAVAFLMKNGASPLAQNKDGTVALDVARKLGSGYSGDARHTQILKAVTKDYGRRDAPSAPAPAIAGDVKPEETQDDLRVLKPIELRQHKSGGGFNL
jgi:hypothetical protein